jgi:plasmid stability protein
MVFWYRPAMKATLEIPDDLLRRIKVEAARSDRKLKDLVAQLLEAGLRASREGSPSPTLPQPVARRHGIPLTAVAIEAATAAGRE